MSAPSPPPEEAFDAAFDARFAMTASELGASEVVKANGSARRVPVDRWAAEADARDLVLFVDRCFGTTLDVGCGPGRLTAALGGRGVSVLGIDISATAVAWANDRGATAVQLDVFADVPDAGSWRHALLADGNIGIGGDPVRLLRRLGELIAADGNILVELERPGVGLRKEQVRLRTDGQLSERFDWAFVGVDVIESLADRAGCAVVDVVCVEGRHVAELRRSRAGR